MRYKPQLIALFMTCLIISSIFGEQNKPRIAVIPFSAINIPEANAKTITGLFETALVKTGVYTVVEQNQISDILQTQKISLSGLTDEKYAIKLGKLLSSEQIILGELSSFGEKYILNVKVIDVTTGMNINADNIKADSLNLITDKVELLAYKVAGLTYKSENTLKIAKNFRELFIETSQEGADVYINGVLKGKGPDLFDHVPIGTITIEAKKDNLYGKVDVNVTESTSSVKILLKETYGNLFIKTTNKELIVYIDGAFIGKINHGFFEHISAGGHDLMVDDGQGSFWRGFVNIGANKTTSLNIQPRFYGTLDYHIPDGAVAEISNANGFLKSLSSYGKVPLWTGEYTINVSGDDYETRAFSIVIKKGEKYNFKPEMKHTEEFIARKKKQDIKNKIIEIKNMKSNIGDQIKKLNRIRNKKNIKGWITIGSSLASAGLFYLFTSYGNSAYDDYKATTITDEAIEYRNKVQLWDTLSYITIGTGLLSAGISVYSFISKPSIKSLSIEYTSLGIEIARLEGELQ